MPRAIIYDSTIVHRLQSLRTRVRRRWGLPYHDPVAAEGTVSRRTSLPPLKHTAIDYCRRLCMHCLQPACVSVCPVGALKKTALGPVVYDEQMHGLPLLHDGLPARFRLRVVETLPLRAEVRHVLRPPERRQADGLRRSLPVGATVNGDRDALIAEARQRIAAKPDQYYKRIYGIKEVGGTSVLYPLGRAV